MGAIDRSSGHEEPDRPGLGGVEGLDGGDAGVDRPRRGRDVLGELELGSGWDTGHLTDEDRRYLDAGSGRGLPEHVVERWLRQRAVYEYWGEDANLDNFRYKDPVDYVAANVKDRPWLAPALDGGPHLQRVFASVDSGGGHFLQRHEGHAADDQRLADRLVYRHDPAQVDDGKRAQMLDGTKPGEHYCGDKATAIKDPLAFAAAFARGIQHPSVREVFDRADVGDNPDPVKIPIEDLLGPDGHQGCVGYQLVPVDGDVNTARKYRNAWAKDVAAGLDPPGQPPQVEEIGSFEGGTVNFYFTPAASHSGWQVLTMYPDPPKEGHQ